jgi:hypothetical protein
VKKGLYLILALALATGTLVLGGSVALADDTNIIHVKQASLDDIQDVNSGVITLWHFVITQVNSSTKAPAQIHVIWDNGDEAEIPLLKVSGKVAHYVAEASSAGSFFVTDATAVIYNGWRGQFNLSHVVVSDPPSSPPDE